MLCARSRFVLPPLGVFAGLVGITLLASGCDSSLQGADSGFAAAFRRNWNRWESQNFDSYEYQFRWTCFCPDTERVRLVVENGEVAAGTVVEDDSPLSASRLDGFKTIDELFALIAAALDDDPAFVRITYDEQNGFPEEVFIDLDEQAADEEISFRVFSVTPFSNRGDGSPSIPSLGLPPAATRSRPRVHPRGAGATPSAGVRRQIR